MSTWNVVVTAGDKTLIYMAMAPTLTMRSVGLIGSCIKHVADKDLPFTDHCPSQQTRNDVAMSVQCWPTVFDAVPTFVQHRVTAGARHLGVYVI